MLRQLTVAILAIALLGVLVPPLAPAKGSIEASLDGPGLEVPLPFAWTHGGAADDPRRGPFEHVALATGFLTAVFAHASMETFDADSRRLRLERLRGALGPKHTLTHRVDGPGGVEIVQDVYPFAEPRPVTDVGPGRSCAGRGAGSSPTRASSRTSSAPGFRPLRRAAHTGSLWAAAVLVAGTLAALLGARRGCLV